MKKALLYLILMTIMIGCDGQSLDLSTINFDKPAEEYPLDKLKVYRKENQNGHWEIKYIGDSVSLELKDNGERVIKYVFIEESSSKNINYSKLPIEPILGATIAVYNDKIAYIDLNILHTSTFEMFQILIDKLGNPTEIIKNDILYETVETGAWDLMIKNIPDYTKLDKEENRVYYPQHLIWNKENTIYKLTLMPSNTVVQSSLMIITKQALRDKVIWGYHVAEKDFLLGKYLK